MLDAYGGCYLGIMQQNCVKSKSRLGCVISEVPISLYNKAELRKSVLISMMFEIKFDTNSGYISNLSGSTVRKPFIPFIHENYRMNYESGFWIKFNN